MRELTQLMKLAQGLTEMQIVQEVYIPSQRYNFDDESYEYLRAGKNIVKMDQLLNSVTG